MQAVILCGGLGTRLRSAVSDRPKCLAEVAGEPFLLLLLDYYIQAGVTQFILATGHLSEQIEALFAGLDYNYRGAKILISREPEPMGTGGALKFAESLLDEEFMMINGDTWMECEPESLCLQMKQTGAEIVLALRQVADVGRYGEVVLDTHSPRIISFAEKSAQGGPGFINAGVYYIKRSALRLIPVRQKCSLETDVFPLLLAEAAMVGVAFAGQFIDIGIPQDYQRAQLMLARS
ncbi:MAG: NDP-sugar pyrophosphorylase family protein [Lentimonas sp.]|jgi:NDP-sugar pyrophosphorylase family protein